MPLRKGKSKKVLKANINTLMGEVGKSPHVKNRKQALAIAYSQQRRSGGVQTYAQNGKRKGSKK